MTTDLGARSGRLEGEGLRPLFRCLGLTRFNEHYVRMGFFSRAWESAGHEYGRQNAERYARVARILRWVRVILVIIFLMWCYYIGARG